MTLRLLVASITLVIFVVAAAVSFSRRPPEPPLIIDAQSPGAWPEYAKVKEGEFTEQEVCMIVFRPVERKAKGITRA